MFNYLKDKNGSILVWVIEPKRRVITVYQSATEYEVLQEENDLTGGDVLPGFSCRLEDFFE